MGTLWDMGVMVGHGEDRMLPNLEAEVLQGDWDGGEPRSYLILLMALDGGSVAASWGRGVRWVAQEWGQSLVAQDFGVTQGSALSPGVSMVWGCHPNPKDGFQIDLGLCAPTLRSFFLSSFPFLSFNASNSQLPSLLMILWCT